jgi:thiol-disulfide isomerase/thioredoxin
MPARVLRGRPAAGNLVRNASAGAGPDPAYHPHRPHAEGQTSLTARISLAVLLALPLAACNPPQPAAPRAIASAAPPLVRPDPPAPSAPRPAAPTGESWGAGQIEWQPTFDAAMARARAERKPVCLVFYADWCGHCRNYSHVFEDPRIVARARDLVMVRVNVDRAPDIAGRYELDGPYVPRTYFLAPDGTPLPGIDAHRPQYRYFYSEHDPRSLLAAMDEAARRR